jgi:transglutaminase-like putative cysteine protease
MHARRLLLSHAEIRLTLIYGVVKVHNGGFNDKVEVCRDFAHLAIMLCRCMNIPARYCTGYLGDIGITPADYHGFQCLV